MNTLLCLLSLPRHCAFYASLPEPSIRHHRVGDLGSSMYSPSGQRWFRRGDGDSLAVIAVEPLPGRGVAGRVGGGI